MPKPFHYQMATRGRNSCDHKTMATRGFLKFLTISIEEVRQGGGPLSTTRLEEPTYKIHMRIATPHQWWEREYTINIKKNVNVIAKAVNTVTYTAVKEVYARFKNKSTNQINNSNNIEVQAEFKDGTNKHKPE